MTQEVCNIMQRKKVPIDPSSGFPVIAYITLVECPNQDMDIDTHFC